MLKYYYADNKGVIMDQKEKSRQTVDYILNCGIKEFAEKGKAVSLNGICKVYGISKGKLYHHFVSKDELLGACVCYCLNALADSIDNFEVDHTISAFENFHNYYSERIIRWQNNPNQLITLRNAYALRDVVFSFESLNNINKVQQRWRESKRKKILEILHSQNNKMRISDENISGVMLLMYENTFQVLEDKMLSAVKEKNDEAIKRYSKSLIEYHDSIINMVLYGAFE